MTCSRRFASCNPARSPSSKRRTRGGRSVVSRGSGSKNDSLEGPPSVDVDDLNDVHHEQLTVVEVLEELNRPGSAAGQGVESLRKGEIGEEDAVERITKAILHRLRESWIGWERHTSATREALRRR